MRVGLTFLAYDTLAGLAFLAIRAVAVLCAGRAGRGRRALAVGADLAGSTIEVIEALGRIGHANAGRAVMMVRAIAIKRAVCRIDPGNALRIHTGFLSIAIDITQALAVENTEITFADIMLRAIGSVLTLTLGRLAYTVDTNFSAITGIFIAANFRLFVGYACVFNALKAGRAGFCLGAGRWLFIGYDAAVFNTFCTFPCAVRIFFTLREFANASVAKGNPLNVFGKNVIAFRINRAFRCGINAFSLNTLLPERALCLVRTFCRHRTLPLHTYGSFRARLRCGAIYRLLTGACYADRLPGTVAIQTTSIHQCCTATTHQ